MLMKLERDCWRRYLLVVNSSTGWILYAIIGDSAEETSFATTNLCNNNTPWPICKVQRITLKYSDRKLSTICPSELWVQINLPI